MLGKLTILILQSQCLRVEPSTARQDQLTISRTPKKALAFVHAAQRIRFPYTLSLDDHGNIGVRVARVSDQTTYLMKQIKETHKERIHKRKILKKKKSFSPRKQLIIPSLLLYLYPVRDLHPRPSVPKTDALSAELTGQVRIFYQGCTFFTRHIVTAGIIIQTCHEYFPVRLLDSPGSLEEYFIQS